MNFFPENHRSGKLRFTLHAVAFLLISCVMISAGRTYDNYLHLDETEKIRVSLFGLNAQQTVTFSADSATVVLYSGELHTQISGKLKELTVALSGDKITIKTPERQVTADSVNIETEKGSVQFLSDDFGERYYSGSFSIRADPRRDVLEIINSVDLETYIASVVGSEMGFHEHEALKTQAVVSRTYALWSIKKSPFPRFDVRDYEANQVYVGNLPNSPRFSEATEATRGEILTWSNKLILAAFSSTCGGKTANNEDVWSGEPHPYLRSQNDMEMCSASTHYEWSYQIGHSELRNLIHRQYGFSFVNRSIQTDQSGRVRSIRFENDSGHGLEFTGNEFRLFINQNSGPAAVRSTIFRWNDVDDRILLEGRGAGHGVGLCQWGARGFANEGWNYKDILSFYFTGVKVVNLNEFQTNRIALYP